MDQLSSERRRDHTSGCGIINYGLKEGEYNFVIIYYYLKIMKIKIDYLNS